MTVRWIAQVPSSDAPVFRVGRDGHHVLAEWPALGVLRVDRHGEGPGFRAYSGVDAALEAKLRTGPVAGLMRHLSGQLTLHASSVHAPTGAVAFLGDSGAGKSTLAYAMCGRGTPHAYELLSDDCLFIEAPCLAVPSEASSWLEPAARHAFGLPPSVEKAPAGVRVARGPASLRAAVSLAYADRLRLTRLRGALAYWAIGGSLVRLILDDPAVNRADAERTATLVERISVFKLERPRGLEHLPDTIRALEGVWSACP